ncbi:ABC transporter ATP-binding protein [Roseomonas sp. E05]|uniref:ABC transporter ATP-binding protein n=1 Tax=Roseomonas sp. E05 TaxID=3046310 RepID=UPI0024BB08F4|nr:ABC transporter ATP-binding protein [Roseomonas sp. E05]MDJ0388317.1 ABC transporter ATP-binding protein [Roseomonas sp. E05]
MAPPAIALRGIEKRFGAVHANRAVDLTVRRGTIHGIIGENGAGKSTLMAILHGFYQADAGSILVNGREVAIRDSRDAIRLGIEMVHQHFMLVERFTVLENVMLGAEGGPLLARGAAKARAELARLGEAFGLRVDPDARIENLPVGAQQRVEILKALYRGAELLILDEPTGVLTPQEADDLFRVLRALRAQGRTVLLITHKLREIMAITDRVSVMRAGRMVAHRETAATSVAELGELMIGRRLAAPAPRPAPKPGPVLLEARNLSVRDAAGVERVKGVDLALRGGEILGIAGVAGNGQGELLEALAGMRRPSAGEIRLGGQTVFPGRDFNPAALRRQRLGHVPEDRLRSGLLRNASAAETAILGYQDDPSWRRFGLLAPAAVAAHAARLMRDYDVRPADPALRSALFSGGNQQKLILAREIDRDPQVLLVGQPTRGVDIGGIDAIHQRLLACRAAGKAVLLVSVELDEIMALADRILVMFDGRIMGELAAAEADEQRLGLLMAGVAPERAA